MDNTNNDPRLVHFTLLARGLHDVGAGRVLTDRGRARIVVGMVMAAKSVASDELAYGDLIRAASGIHADQKEQKTAYAEAWAFFRNNTGEVRGKLKPDDVRIDRHYAPERGKDDMGATGRAIENAPVGARVQALMFAASVLIHFDACGVNWDNIAQGKGDDAIVTDESNMKLLYVNLKKDKSIANWVVKDYPISTYGQFRFSPLAEEGNNELRRRNVKKAAPRRTADTTAMRDRLTLVAKDLDEADAKSYDAAPDDSKALAAFVGIANALNDSTLKGVRFNNSAYSIINAMVEGAKAEAKGEEVPKQYKALLDFYASLMDKSIAKKAA